MNIAVRLTEEEARRLAEIADRLNVPQESLAGAAVRELVDTHDADFRRRHHDAAGHEESRIVRAPSVTRYLGLAEVLAFHDRIIEETGGSHGLRDLGLRDLGLLESALAQPQQTFGGEDLPPASSRKPSRLDIRSSEPPVHRREQAHRPRRDGGDAHDERVRAGGECRRR